MKEIERPRAAPLRTPAATSAPASVPDSAARPRFGYQPGLDGIRAFAIVAVMLYHYFVYGHPIVWGGYLGVDAFFVLSGFLITTLLLGEYHASGRISLRRFYVRRALRLLPLVAVVLLFAIVANRLAGPHSTAAPTGRGILASAFYYANWFSLHHKVALGFLQPTWSLSIEEQFYLVWPIVLIGLLALGLSRRSLAITACLAFVAAWLYRLSLFYRRPPNPSFIDFYLRATLRAPPPPNATPDSGHVYYGSDTRAHMLLAGCALACVLMWLGPRIPPALRRYAGVLAGVGAVVAAAFLLQAFDMSREWVAQWGVVIFELSIVAIIIGVVVTPRSLLARFLALPPLVWIGRRAYGLYLIHLGLYWYLGPDRVGLGVWGTFAFVFALAFVLAALSFRYIEAPALRLKDRFSGLPVR